MIENPNALDTSQDLAFPVAQAWSSGIKIGAQIGGEIGFTGLQAGDFSILTAGISAQASLFAGAGEVGISGVGNRAQLQSPYGFAIQVKAVEPVSIDAYISSAGIAAALTLGAHFAAVDSPDFKLLAFKAQVSAWAGVGMGEARASVYGPVELLTVSGPGGTAMIATS